MKNKGSNELTLDLDLMLSEPTKIGHISTKVLKNFVTFNPENKVRILFFCGSKLYFSLNV